MFSRRTLLALLVLWLACCGAVSAAPNGESLYRQYCAACHQTRGEGGIGLPLSTSKLASVSDDYLTKTIRLGRPGRIMPAFDELSDAQVAALVAYIRSWCNQPGMEFPTTPIAGNPRLGEALYRQHCVECHGEDGSGEGPGTGVTRSRERRFLVMPPAINNPGFLKSAPDQMIRHTIATGRQGSIMPVFGDRLTKSAIDDIVAYVRTFEALAEQTRTESAAAIEPSHVVESPYDFSTTVENVRQALIGSNFRLFPDRFLEEGLTDEFSHNTRQISIRFCNFKQLYNMLNIEPRLGVVLPCRIAIVERSDGSVLLVAPNMQAISHWFNNHELERLGNAMEEMITGVIEEATL